MKDSNKIEIEWPDGSITKTKIGTDWMIAANQARFDIPTGCLGGSCGACEIEINGELIRSCISKVKKSKTGKIKVQIVEDPYW